tara:strand:- start:33 stop:140 length:108 start_codon:yes stop_codon:yes gene_type:complete
MDLVGHTREARKIFDFVILSKSPPASKIKQDPDDY